MMTAKQRLQWTEEVHHLGASKTHLDDSTTLERRSTPRYANTTFSRSVRRNTWIISGCRSFDGCPPTR
jgi:hypothetical protein